MICPRQEWLKDDTLQLYILEKMGVQENFELTSPCSCTCCEGCRNECAFSCRNAEKINKVVNERKKRMAKKEILDNRKFVIEMLKKTGREYIEDLIDEMDRIGFFTAPCSGGNHLCCEFGLVQHTRNVIEAGEKIGVALLGGEEYNKIQASVIICTALHDLGKCGDHGKALYVPNILKSGKQSEAKPYERNKELPNIPHAFRSVIIANRWIDLTPDEEYAIMYHDGLYDRETGGMAVVPGHETPLLLILHWADMWAAHVVETKTVDKAEEPADKQ